MHLPQDSDDLSVDQHTHIDTFSSLWGLISPRLCAPVLMNSKLASYAAIPLFNPGPIDLASKLHRSAISVIMSPKCNTSSNDYLPKYYMEAKKCIEKSSLSELLFGSYVVAVWSLADGPSITTAIHYVSQFCTATLCLIRSPRDNIDLNWVEILLQSLLMSLCHTHLDFILLNGPEKPEQLVVSFEQRQHLIDNTLSILPTENDLSRLPRSMTTEIMLHKIRTLSIYLHLQLEHFLFQSVVDSKATVGLGKILNMIVTRIVDLIPRLSSISDYIFYAYANMSSRADEDDNNNPSPSGFLWYPKVVARGLKSEARERDTALAILYVFSQFLKNMLDAKPDTAAVLAEIRESAIALCRLCDSFSEPHSPMAALLIQRTLFWATMVLTKSKFPEGMTR
jgi:hypothetical protein